VPTWQEGRSVAALVARLLALGVSEVIVADADSPDGTAAIAAAAGARVVGGARGRGPQLRLGAAAATGEVVWIVHADARPPDGAVAAIEAALEDPGVVGGAFLLHTVDDADPPRFGRLLRVADLRSRYTRRPYGDQALFCRRAALERVGGVPPLALFEDLALSTALWREGRLVRLPLEVKVSGRRFSAAPLRSFLTMWTLPVLWRLGVPADTLARLYNSARA
jgi:glycosyltransferase involved in cell wall biosynthesis